MKRQKRTYLTSQQLSKELIASQQDGQPTEQLCIYFRLIATKLLGSPKYRGYPRHMQEDMASAALIKCLKNVHNFKEEYSDKAFSYYTRCCEFAFWEVLGKHYQQVNIMRDLSLEYANAIESIMPNEAKLIRDSQIEVERTKRLVTFGNRT